MPPLNRKQKKCRTRPFPVAVTGGFFRPPEHFSLRSEKAALPNSPKSPLRPKLQVNGIKKPRIRRAILPHERAFLPQFDDRSRASFQQRNRELKTSINGLNK